MIFIFFFLSSGVHGFIQTAASVSKAIPKGAQLHETDPIAQVPGGVRSGEGDQSGQLVVGVVRKVSQI